MQKIRIYHRRASKRGFTIIELMVVIVIISIVAAMGNNAFKNQRTQAAYNDSILHVLTMIKTARDYAVTSRPVFDPSLSKEKASFIPPEGYGVYVKRNDGIGQTHFILFANTAADNDINKNQFDEGKVNNDIVEEDYLLPSDTLLTNLLTDLKEMTKLGSNSNQTENEAVIIFRPPLADATIAANDHPLKASSLTKPENLYLEFRKINSAPTVPPNYIHMNRLGGFAEVINQ